MAERHWVGGTESWNGTAGSKWSLTAGGAGGEAEPTAADDVFFDAASGAVTVTVVTTTGVCRSLDFTGFTGTFNNVRQVNIGDATVGNTTLGSGMTYITTSGTLQFVSTASTNLITSNGITFGSRLTFGSDAGAGGAWKIQDALTIGTFSGRYLAMFGGTLDTNGMSVTVSHMTGNDLGAAWTLTLGASQVTISGNGVSPPNVWDWSSANASSVLNAGTSTILLSDTGNTAHGFHGGGRTYNNVNVSGGGTGVVSFIGANTFANFPQITDGTKSIRFTAATTQTYTGGTSFGNGANLITIDSNIAGTAATLSKASGTVECTSISLKDSTAAGGALWYAGPTPPSVDVSGNTGWTFSAVPIAGGGNGVQQNALLLGVG